MDDELSIRIVVLPSEYKVVSFPTEMEFW